MIASFNYLFLWKGFTPLRRQIMFPVSESWLQCSLYCICLIELGLTSPLCDYSPSGTSHFCIYDLDWVFQLIILPSCVAFLLGKISLCHNRTISPVTFEAWEKENKYWLYRIKNKDMPSTKSLPCLKSVNSTIVSYVLWHL